MPPTFMPAAKGSARTPLGPMYSKPDTSQRQKGWTDADYVTVGSL